MTAVEAGDLPLAKASGLVQQVHAELKRRILDGRISPGTDVPDSVIAKQMGVSRAPVRDACNFLVQSGLLTKQQNHPYRVRQFSESDLGELQLIRWGYESAAVRRLVAARLPPTGVYEPLERMSRAGRDDDGLASGLADIDFHLALVSSAGLAELTRRHVSLMDQMSLTLRQIPRFAVSTQRHRHEEILEVLAESTRAGNPDSILRLVGTHLLTSRDGIRQSTDTAES